MITYAQFILDYPEFATANQSQFNLYQNRATLHLTAGWGGAAASGQPYSQYDIGMELIIGHFLARAAMRALTVAGGGIPLAKGVMSAESAGPGSVNYDTNAAIEEGAGHWNETDYGREYVQMARLIGAGPTQVSPAPDPNPLNGQAWPGPWPYPGYFG